MFTNDNVGRFTNGFIIVIYYPTYKQNNYFRTHFTKLGKSSQREVTAIYFQK